MKYPQWTYAVLMLFVTTLAQGAFKLGDTIDYKTGKSMGEKNTNINLRVENGELKAYFYDSAKKVIAPPFRGIIVHCRDTRYPLGRFRFELRQKADEPTLAGPCGDLQLSTFSDILFLQDFQLKD